MTGLKADLCVILQDVKHVPLGASLEPIADRIVARFAESIASEETVVRMTAALERHPLVPVKGQGPREFARSLAETAVQSLVPDPDHG